MILLTRDGYYFFQCKLKVELEEFKKSHDSQNSPDTTIDVAYSEHKYYGVDWQLEEDAHKCTHGIDWLGKEPESLFRNWDEFPKLIPNQPRKSKFNLESLFGTTRSLMPQTLISQLA